MGPIKSLVGQKYGMLTVVKYLGTNKHRASRYLCVCECGNTREVVGGKLKEGVCYSCGCTRRYKTHCMSKTRLYRIWVGLRNRCNLKDENALGYKNYAGKGITYCKEWEKFESFMQWALANGYADDLQIDRIDSNGNYCPENCRWVTPYENIINRKVTRMLTINGVEKPVIEWSRENNINVGTVYNRLKWGWSPYDAVFTPTFTRYRNRSVKKHEAKNA